MKVVQILPETGWTGLDNRVIRDRQISVRAIGLLTVLLSYPTDNNITIAKLAGFGAEARKKGIPMEGREALQGAMRELERAGHVVHVKGHDRSTGRWSTTTYVSSDPAAIAQYAPSTALPRPVSQRSGSQPSGDRRSGSQSSSTYKTDDNTGYKTEGQDAGLQYVSSLASAREGQLASEQDRVDRIESALSGMYEGVRQADETYLRDRLLKFERKRPAIFRNCRNAAIGQIETGQHAKRLKEVGASRLIDELAMMYAVRHYATSESGVVPQWLIRFPLRSVA